MSHRHKLSLHRGFTLIEWMVTLSLIGILAGITAPHWSAAVRHIQLISTTNHFIAILHTTKSEGMKRNLHTFITPIDASNDWSKGWKAFVDVDFSNDYSEADLLIQEISDIPASISMQGNGVSAATPSYIMYDGSGFSKNKHGGFGAHTMTFRLHNAAHPSDIRHIKIAATGRIRVCSPPTTAINDNSCNNSSND